MALTRLCFSLSACTDMGLTRTIPAYVPGQIWSQQEKDRRQRNLHSLLAPRAPEMDGGGLFRGGPSRLV